MTPAWRLRQRARERVCTCSSYPHPHRQFGGACSGYRWVAAFFAVGKRECVHCVNYTGHQCEVAIGQEQAFHCPELRDYVRYEGITLYGRARRMMDRAQRKIAA